MAPEAMIPNEARQILEQNSGIEEWQQQIWDLSSGIVTENRSFDDPLFQYNVQKTASMHTPSALLVVEKQHSLSQTEP